MNTLLASRSIDAQIVQDKLSYTALSDHKKQSIFDVKIIVDGSPASVTDVACLNGAIHAIDRILDPRHSYQRRDPVKPLLEGPHTQFKGIINSPNHGSFPSRSWRRTARHANTNSAGDRGCAEGPQHHIADE